MELTQSTAESAASYVNTYFSLDPWLSSTGFRTHGLRNGDPGGRPPGIAEEFLVGTRYRKRDRETETSVQGYFLDSGVCMLARNGEENLEGLTVLPLPAGVRMRREMGEVLARRRSCRSYTGDPLTLEQLATVVRACGAQTGMAHVDLVEGGDRQIGYRTAPSPGGLYPTETWIVPLRVRGLPPSVYLHDPRGDQLVTVAPPHTVQAVLDAVAVPEEIISVSRAAALVLLVGRPWKVTRKYGDRGIRYLFLEAGAISENAHLACGALGLGSVDCASVHDDAVHDALGLDGESALLVHTLIIGVPA